MQRDLEDVHAKLRFDSSCIGTTLLMGIETNLNRPSIVYTMHIKSLYCQKPEFSWTFVVIGREHEKAPSKIGHIQCDLDSWT